MLTENQYGFSGLLDLGYFTMKLCLFSLSNRDQVNHSRKHVFTNIFMKNLLILREFSATKPYRFSKGDI
jgi:hypothetical protein